MQSIAHALRLAPAGHRCLRSLDRWLLGVLLLCVVSAPLAAREPAQEKDWAPLPRGWPLEPFSLVDQHGKAFTQANLRGQWTFTLLGDTRCGAPCANALQALAGLRQRIAGTQKSRTTQVVFVSLRTASSAELRQYLAQHDPTFIGVSGDAAVVGQLARELELDALLKHGAAPAGSVPKLLGTLALIDPEGALRTKLAPPFEVEQLTARYLRLRLH